MRLVVGCPVRQREWIIRDWAVHLAAACWHAGIEDHEIVAVGHRDDVTIKALRCQSRPLHVVEVDEPAAADERDWTAPGRYEHMARLRNLLLGRVRELEPEYFLSLDSDILIHPLALASMGKLLHERSFGAVGGKAHMKPHGRRAPSYASLTAAGGLLRFDSSGQFPVDVIMAIKLMTPAAYHVDYVEDGRAEDVGWSKAARAAGLTLGWDGTHTSKHVMTPEMLHEVDERCGY